MNITQSTFASHFADFTIPTTCIATLITHSHDRSEELSSWNYFTSDILQ